MTPEQRTLEIDLNYVGLDYCDRIDLRTDIPWLLDRLAEREREVERLRAVITSVFDRIEKSPAVGGGIDDFYQTSIGGDEIRQWRQDILTPEPTS